MDVQVLDKLRDGLDAHGVADLVGGLHQGIVDGIVQHFLDEVSVQLQVIDPKVLEIIE